MYFQIEPESTNKTEDAVLKGHGAVRDELLFVLAEELFPVLDEANGDHNSRPRKADEEHYLKQPHGKNGKSHTHDCSPTFGASAQRFGLRPEEAGDCA